MPKMFGKVFFAFWASSLVVLLAVGTLGAALGARPLLYQWLTNSLNLYAQTAADLYEHGGKAALTNYLDDIRNHSAIDSALFDARGIALGQHSIPAETGNVLAQALSTGKSQYDHKHWVVAVVVSRAHGIYIFAAKAHPWRLRYRAFDPLTTLVRGSVALLVASLLCLIIARYLTKPIRSLQMVTKRIASGDLSARAVPLVGRRDDEISELAADFDRMAERVQMLILRQQTLLRDISHELRSPLARLTLSTELARRGDTSALQRMDSDIRRLEALISELLTLSRIESSEHTTRRDTIHLAELVRQIIQDAQFEGQAEGKDIIQTGADDLVLIGDANLLQRCIENVIRNAVRYTQANTTVEVNLAQIEMPGRVPAAQIRVVDHGPGVPPEALPYLFEPFFRVSEAREQRSGGTGVGLSISQRVVLLHEGNIQAANMPAGGLEVTIDIPLAVTDTLGCHISDT